MTERPRWLDAIDLDPTHPWLRMGTRTLGDQPWLVADEHRADDLTLKGELLRDRRPEVYACTDKLGRPLGEVHGPTPGYDPSLNSRVTALLDRLERPVRRRNWFVHPDPARFQPEAPAVDQVRPSAEVDTGLHVRSERQTLSRLPTGWIVFTIRTQQVPLGVARSDPAWAAAFDGYLASASEATLAHRGMSPAQVAEIRS